MKKHWWANGVNMKEWITFVLICIYAAVAIIIAAKLYNKQLVDQDNEFFWILSWPVMVIVGFYFAEKIALNFGKYTRISAKGKDDQKESDTFDDTPV